MLDMRSHHLHAGRVDALRRSGLLQRASEDEFGHLTDHVRDVLDVPVAIITLVDEDRQVFAGHSGLPEPWAERGETPMTHSFCQHVVDRQAPLVTSDARLDPTLRDNAAIGDIGVVAYLGVPLTLPDGEIVGALAAIDTQPRSWTEADMRRLRSIARTVDKEMAVRISESRWRSMFEGLQEGFILGRVVRDETGRIIDWMYEAVNAAWHDLLGVPHGTAVGRTVRELLPGVEDAWVDEFAGVVETGEPARFTRRVGTLDRWYDGVAQPIGGDRFTVIFIEVTERIRRERRQATLLTLADELRGRSDLETIVTAAARCLADGLEVDRMGSGLVNLREDTIDVASDWCEPGMSSVVGQHDFSSYGSYIADLKRGAIVAVDDVASDPRTSGRRASFDAIDTRSFLDLPISFDGRLYAVVFAHSRTLHAWTDGERQFAEQVGDRVRAALARLRMEDAQRVLTQEMSHRMKNALAMVQAIATQTLRQAQTMDEAREAISSRLSALARAQDILTRTNFTEADVREVAEAAIAPHRLAGDRIAMSGPHADLTAQRALGLSLAIHELATNAAKYGALSNAMGRVDVTWDVVDGAFAFHWIESGGPPVTAPERRGFGSKLIERIVSSYFDGEGHIDFDPAGIRFTLTGALAHPASQPNV
ncbi:Two-component sensor histidine kinase, contains HisKA and HATPase domains [Aureimonas jatrophae]|uniref:histidine kinase n=2 Tax=Aureimonas jatrophae TaxID=1166073 RepID=A0A1H0N349_9HYPH|nr:Two-component sensor histidine kinase, contains HisKA and HATPase domains [Aureimonas jatrophae]